ncbi:PIN domain-containing protein [Sphingomonas sp. AP4-R1]|uniref:PIN domain-containing protein n=1 Tax=Sphingomonas sp. AP4-R1 TaxID=2735134 RepID=UPI001493C417|nr:PIN domain-containing protein [Sphingomonas sp. AP4-R1]QJU56478.1 PIN domain-containing protein [Sphingomonas sp. AP4-R1]
MTDRWFLDTNVLLYAISQNPADVEKGRIARSLVFQTSCALSVQVFQEFLNQATHPKGGFGLSLDAAEKVLAGYRRFPVQETTLALFDTALAVTSRTGYSIWDSLIVAAAQALGCNILYSEDMQDGRIIDGLRILNPFREGASLPWVS